MAKDKKTPPDIVAIEQQLKSDYSARDDLILEMRRLRDMENIPDVPAGMEAERVTTPVASQIVERMVGLLCTDPIRIEVPPPGKSDAQQRRASLIEKWTLSALDVLEHQADEDVRERMIESMIVDGAGACRMLYSPGRWAGMPKKKDFTGEDDDYVKSVDEWTKGKPLPITWAWLDPMCVYPMWSEAGLECVLEVDERDVATLNPDRFNNGKEFPKLWELDRHTKTDGKIKFSQLWTRDTLTYSVNDKIVHHTKHNYQRPPYAYALGQSISSKDIGKRGRSMLYNLRYLIPYYERLLSQKATGIRIYNWPTPIFQQGTMGPLLDGQTGTAAPLRNIELTPGKAVSLYNDEKISFLTWLGNGPDADKMIGLMQNHIESAGLSESMFGQSTGDSGYGIAQLVAAARVRFKPLILHAERAIESQIQCLYDIIEYQIKQPVSVYVGGRDADWLTLRPEDLNGYRQIKVTLNPIIPTDNYARSSQAINEVQSGLRSKESAMEMIGIEQPDVMSDEILVEEYKADPQVKAFVMQEALKRAKFTIAEQEVNKSAMSEEELAAIIQQLPPALQQAIINGQGQQGAAGAPAVGQPGEAMMDTSGMGQGAAPVNPGMFPTTANSGAQTMTSPGTYGTPAPPPTPQMIALMQAMRPGQGPNGAAATATRGKVGPTVKPRGVAQGRPSGPHKRASE